MSGSVRNASRSAPGLDVAECTDARIPASAFQLRADDPTDS